MKQIEENLSHIGVLWFYEIFTSFLSSIWSFQPNDSKIDLILFCSGVKLYSAAPHLLAFAVAKFGKFIFIFFYTVHVHK